MEYSEQAIALLQRHDFAVRTIGVIHLQIHSAPLARDFLRDQRVVGLDIFNDE